MTVDIEELPPSPPHPYLKHNYQVGLTWSQKSTKVCRWQAETFRGCNYKLLEWSYVWVRTLRRNADNKKVLKINDPNQDSLRKQKKKKKNQKKQTTKFYSNLVNSCVPQDAKTQVLYGVRLSGKGILHRIYLYNFIFTYVTSQSRWQHKISMPYINFFSKTKRNNYIIISPSGICYVSYKSLSIVSYITYLLLFAWTYSYHTSLGVL